MNFRPAATLLLIRPAESPRGFELLWLHRNPKLRFLANFWVFPGGRVDRGEEPREAALRECFEESGILLFPGADALDPARLEAARKRLLDEKRAWPEVKAELGLGPAGEVELTPCGRWKTPPFGPVRFDTDFFLACVPPETEFEVWPGELDRGEWIDPAQALARWAEDKALLAPPTRVSLEALAAREGDPSDPTWLAETASAIAASHPAEGEWLEAIDFRPGLRMVLVRTPTLPPATHTNCLIVGDGEELVVIDPASPYPEERARLDAVLDGLLAEGRRVREILLTHHHPDHASGAEYLAERLGVPIAAHARTRELLQGQVPVSREVADGELIELPAEEPKRTRRLRAVLCEGHADGHLAFYEETSGSLIAGDMVAGVGTILIDPPEGRMGDYLRSLEALRELSAQLLYPAHGPPQGNPEKILSFFLKHRRERHAKVLAALTQAPQTIPELVPSAYADKPPEVYPLAERAALAHLLELAREGLAQQEGEARWVRSEPAGCSQGD